MSERILAVLTVLAGIVSVWWITGSLAGSAKAGHRQETQHAAAVCGEMLRNATASDSLRVIRIEPVCLNNVYFPDSGAKR